MTIRITPNYRFFALLAIGAFFILLSFANPLEKGNAPAATIGGNAVPTDLHCQEDEIIGFIDNELGCIHQDLFAEVYRTEINNDDYAAQIAAENAMRNDPNRIP